MKFKHNLLLFTVFTMATSLFAQEYKSLAGKWRFALDPNSEGQTGQWFQSAPAQEIQLPGTTDEARFGQKTTGSDFGILTRAYKYYGPAWYQQEIIIPEDWKSKRIFLELERVMWESKVYLDDCEISTLDALNSPHYHDLGYITPGKHHLTMRINNDLIHNIGDKGHAYTEYTQSIWNGVVGNVRLVAREPVRFTSPRIETIVSSPSMRIQDTIINETSARKRVEVTLTLQERGRDEIFLRETFSVDLQKGKNCLDLKVNIPANVRLWDDMNPNLYETTLTLSDRGKVANSYDQYTQEIGFREITTQKSKILVNGQPVFLRGNLDCVHFPLTGYPSCNVSEWERIFRIYKSYGLNHARFHSWCPPRAAFVAADRVGIYLQPEAIWIDWWMTKAPDNRPEMMTKGTPEGLGKNPSADAFTRAELKRMVQSYGNHASFAMMCIGNELGNSDFDVMQTWLEPYRKEDNRRIYAVSTARKVMAVDQFMATHYLPGIGATRGLKGGASTDWDFEDTYSKSSIPVIAHEIGQWPVYPRWSEIKKYTGTLKARNFEEFKQQAERNHIAEQNEDFVKASGALNQLMYKYEIESFLRTPSCAGIQLLSLQDYQGQGEALIGWLDAFYDSKGITTPEKFRAHHDTTVTLLRTPKFVWENTETFEAKIQLAHYGQAAIHDQVKWTIAWPDGRLLASGNFESQKYLRGSSDLIGQLSVPLFSVPQATPLTVTVSLKERPVSNSWKIWVYPKQIETKAGKVLTCNRLDDSTLTELQNGASVLLDASALGNEATMDPLSFYPLYWSLTFFPGQGKNTIGLLVKDRHPAFEYFPTDYHSDWQWEKVYKNSRAFYLNDYPADYQAIAQPIDDFHRNNKLGVIFEVSVGKGKLLVCGFPLKDQTNPVVRQLRHSLITYMNTPSFAPEIERSVKQLKEVFTYTEPVVSEVPKEFDNALLYIECAARNEQKNKSIPWNPSLDKVVARKKTTSKVTCDGVWTDQVGTAWHGKEIAMNIDCPQGMIGSLYLFFEDWNNNGRRGTIQFEGRNFELQHHKNGTWVKLHVMREDSNDGELLFKAKALTGPNLMISKVVLIEE
ncbi:MAG: sugar-binding domain-containing protein [Bacteroidales bacterium]